MSSRLRLGVTAVVIPVLALGAGLTTAIAPAGASLPAGSSRVVAAGPANQRVIVILRNQLSSLPATSALVAERSDAVRADQGPVISALHAAGTSTVHAFTTLNALSATVSTGEEQALRANPAVAEVVPDQVIPNPDSPSASVGASKANAAAVAAATGGQAFCAPAGAKPQLNPEALQATNTDSDTPGAKTARSLGLTGAGVKVAFMAEGIDTDNPDFIRADGSHVFVDYKDFTGDGTAAPTTGGEAFIDASSIAAQGRETYDVSHFSALPLSAPCRIRIEGVAPGASLVGLKVFGTQHVSYESGFLQAIDYAVAVDHVDVLSQSFGSNPFPDTAQDVTRMFDDAAVRAGVTVVASSGDAGVTNTIGSPASDPNVISTGATTTYRFDLQTGYAFARGSGATGYLNDNISSLSSGGVTEAGRTVDLVAPGELGFGLCSADVAMYSDCLDFNGAPSDVEDVGGTSEAAPLTAGAAALVIQAYEESHHGRRPTPALVKTILTGTATDISAPADQQGTGLLNSYKAVQAALSAPGSTHRVVGNALLTSSDQIDVATTPGTTLHEPLVVTNTGATTQRINARTRAVGTYRTLRQTTVVLANATSAHATDFQGYTDNVEVVKFRVPAGLARLDTSIAYQGASAALAARVRLTLIDPKNRLAGYSLPQGIGNYGDSQVAHPVAGVWTAYITSRQPADGGSTGAVVFGARGATFTSVGSISPRSLTLAPGHSGTLTFSGTTSTTPGDVSTAIVLTSTSGHVSSVSTVPVILRSVEPVTAAPKKFSVTLRGGNGRSTFGEVTGYYALKVPAGLPELNSVIQLSSNIRNPFAAYLISPSGQAVSFAGSQALGADSAGNLIAVYERSAQLHVLKPAAGRWMLIVNFAPTVSGKNLSQQYTVETDGRAVKTTATGLPTSAKTTIARGTTRTIKVTVHNGGSAPELFFLDPRRNTSVTYPLVVTPSKVTLPDTGVNGEPSFLVPTDSSEVSARLAGTGPVAFDFGTDFGDPDIGSITHGDVANAAITGAPVAQGGWFLGPDEVGPFGAAVPPTITGVASAAVRTKMFDPTMRSSTGDLWLTSVNASAEVTPVLVLPGRSKTITVTISPTGPKGRHVSGVLYVDDANLLNVGDLVPNGNQVAELSYAYTIG